MFALIEWCIGLFWVAVLALAVVQVVLIFLLWWRRRQRAHANHTPYNTVLEFVWTILPVGFLVALVVFTWSGLSRSC